jgi:tRNA(Ile)-lysidine synthase
MLSPGLLGIREDLLSRVLTFIRDHHLISRGELVLAAVSGGVDSMVMLEILHRISDEVGFLLHVAHFDHMLRGEESARDAELVRTVADQRGLPFTAGRGDVAARMNYERKGLEETARTMRYGFLFDLGKRLDARRIATGHHADDQAETVLLRLLRGTGVRGLAGIRPCDARGLIRPLLPLRKSEIMEFARAHEVPYREDPTNVHAICMRNFLRNDFLPSLGRERQEMLILSLSSLAESARGAAAFLEEKVRDACRECLVHSGGGAVTLDLKKTRGYHYFVRNEIYRKAYSEARGKSTGLPRRTSLLLSRLCEQGQSGREIALPGKVRAMRSFDAVTLTKEPVERWNRPQAAFTVEPGMDTACTVGRRAYRVRTHIEAMADPSAFMKRIRESGRRDVGYFDAGKLSFPLSLRGWSRGDRLSPFSFQGTKKVSDLFLEGRVPRDMRGCIPLLTDTERVLWVVGLRRSSHAVVVDGTRTILVVRVTPEGE